MTGLCRLAVAGILSFDFGGQREFDQAPNCFRARGLVMLLLGPAFNSMPHLSLLFGRLGGFAAGCLRGNRQI